MLRDRVVQEAEARQLPALIAEWLERSDALQWVARALQLDLPLLIERPELVLPCLYRRCFWLGNVTFYPDRAAIPERSNELSSLVEGWLAEQPMRWLRSLRPPPYPMDAGVIEEYRTSLKGDLRFSADGSLIGVIGNDTTITWERVTGRRIEEPLANPAPRWTHEWAKAKIALRSLDRTWDLPIASYETCSQAWDLGDDLVLAKSWYEPDPYDDITTYVLYLVDASTGRIRWRVEDDCQSAILVSDTVLVFGKGIVRRSLATGEGLGSQAFPWASTVVFSPDGTLVATRDDCVIRVWNLAQLAPKIDACCVSGGEISLDGKLLLAGEMLCNAQTGALIAEIPFHGRGNWLEGGPPSGAWSHANGVVLEVLWGARVWNAEGQLVAEYDHHTSARDAVRIDPLGRYWAFFESPVQLTVYEIRTGAKVFETQGELLVEAWRQPAFGWRGDGQLLWWQTADKIVRGVVPGIWQIGVIERPGEVSSTLEITDGLLIVGDLAAPMDSNQATSHGGTIFAGADHYRLEG